MTSQISDIVVPRVFTPYMSAFLKERLSDRMIEDMRAYFEQL